MARLAVLTILDGWGIGKPGPWNAITMAQTPNMDAWWKKYPHTLLSARGEAVGLPGDTTGNSEVGHMNLGAGYVVEQDLVRINHAIKSGTFFSDPALIAACQHAKEPGQSLHILMLVGPGQVHSDIDHLWAMLELAKQQGVANVYVHMFSDGRDSSPNWMGKNAQTVQHKVESYGAHVASLSGRYFAMDRDKRWDRTELVYKVLTERKGKHAADLSSAVKQSYDSGKTDEFIEPTVIGNGRAIQDGDSVVFLNFRTDRPRQLSRALHDPDFTDFARSVAPQKLFFTTMTEYQKGFKVDGIAFPPQHVDLPIAKVISEAGMKQLHAAETEKYAHVTYFFNGGQETPFPGEDRVLIPSPKVATYDHEPKMSADQLTKAVCEKINTGAYDLVVLNYANADMVSHTGDLDASIKAVEEVDTCLAEVFAAVQAQDGVMFITADHGNAEVLYDPVTHEVDTQHNPSDVPFMAVGEQLPGTLKDGGRLANVSPTLLQFMGLPIPPSMTAESLWREEND